MEEVLRAQRDLYAHVNNRVLHYANKGVTINLINPDNGEKFLIEMKNATLTNIEGFQPETPDLILTTNREDLVFTMTGKRSPEDQIANGAAQAEGDRSALAKLTETMVDFDPLFEILPGTNRQPTEVARSNAFEAVTGAPTAE